MPTSLDHPRLSAGELFAAAARLYGDRVAVVDGAERLTFAQLHAHAAGFARAVRDTGVRDGDVVLLHLSNSVWFPVAYYGALLAGATVSPANPLQPAPGLRAQLDDTGAVLAVSHPAHVGALLEAAAPRNDRSDLRTIVLVPPSACAPSAGDPPAGTATVDLADMADLPAGRVDLAGMTDGRPAAAPRITVGADDVAHIAYTGGTTGVPKGVRVLHRNVVANAVQMTAWRAAHLVAVTGNGALRLDPIPGLPDAGVRPGDAVTVMVPPLFHAHALIHLNFLLLCGTTVVFTGRFSPERLLEAIEDHRATYVTGSPAMWHALLDSPELGDRDLSSVQVISSGAAPIDAAALRALGAAFPGAMLSEGYGMTEATCLVAATPLLRGGRRSPGSVGLPVPGTTVRIRPVGGGADVLGPNETGELWVRGPQVTAGYLNAPEVTAEQFTDGWLRTGDVGHVDEEGFVFVADRAKDMLIYKGYNVYPRELEDVLHGHPGVARAAVVARSAPRVGQEPVAFVVPRPGARVDPDEVMAFVAERVLPYKRIRAVHVVGALPTSPAGKVVKAELRARIATGR
ncbi:class I adenylate-forming enzyme family protein [Actinomadura sp. WMMB 499]|uniref:class I adenylate-forming enzyme family protein n=1 Tax=Actinomadura sp. WMMB 499 TaxID=1219491 RepID=UPI0012444431|nr:AMP-binding protein [Actinomadura sp. WMMB 499]QFG22220.1 long-chain fatty acid--CoA ligase [Actinomadura sp. WMMB 499]